MTLTELAVIANDYTDENFANNVLLGFTNVAVSRINVLLKSKLPLFNLESDYTALPVDWIHIVIIPFVCWSIKMNDGSLNEAQAYLYQFERGLDELRKNKRTVISEEYRGEGFSNMYQINRYNRM